MKKESISFPNKKTTFTQSGKIQKANKSRLTNNVDPDPIFNRIWFNLFTVFLGSSRTLYRNEKKKKTFY